MSNPVISIITVCYNAEQEIQQTLQSVLNQTYNPIEYIIIDGASTDNTLKIIEPYRDRLSHFISEPDNGIYDAMNKGLNHAKGQYVNFMNAGDIFKCSNTVNNLMEKSDHSDLIYGLAEVITKDGHIRPWHKRTPSSKEISYRSFLSGMVICHQCFIAKRELVPLYETKKWSISNDIDWSIRLMKRVKTAYFFNEIICTFLDGGISDKKRKKALIERFSILVHHFGFFPAVIEQIKTIFRRILQ